MIHVYIMKYMEKYLNLLSFLLLNSAFVNTPESFAVSLQGGNLIPVARSEIQPQGASSLLRGLSLPCALSESYAYLRTYGLYVWNDARKEEARKTSRKAPRANRSNEIMLYYSDFANLY